MRGYRVTTMPMIIYGIMLWGVGFIGGYYMCFHGEAFGGPYGVYGFWGATTLGLILTGICLSIMALLIGRHIAKNDEHSAEEIARALEESVHGVLTAK